MTFKVTATSLNLRSQPKVSATNRIAVLPNGQTVEKISEETPPWWKVSTVLGGATLVGFTSSEFLAEVSTAPAPPSASGIVKVHMPLRSGVTRAVSTGRAFPLNEPGQPTRNGTTPDQRVDGLRRIIDWLDVKNKARYTPTSKSTFCNIYAYDYCFLADAYLPRVWWTSGAIADLSAGRTVKVEYDKTVRELNANSLVNWLQDFGGMFGWTRVASQNDLQDAANLGSVAVIATRRVDLNTSGHICMVVPEKPPLVASRKNNVVILPLQSQAGAKNFSYSTGTTRWWTDAKFGTFGFWIHD